MNPRWFTPPSRRLLMDGCDPYRASEAFAFREQQQALITLGVAYNFPYCDA